MADSLPVPPADLLRSILDNYRPKLSIYEDIYRDVHQNPEVSGMESRTTSVICRELEKLGFDVHSDIIHPAPGVAGIFENGPGMTILMRAELFASPILEDTALPYQSTKWIVDKDDNLQGVMHACGHDMNMAALLGASALLKAASEKWQGRLVVFFQSGKKATVGTLPRLDGWYFSKILTKLPKPDMVLGQHVMPSKAGTVAIRSGPVRFAEDTINIRIPGNCHLNSADISNQIIQRIKKEMRKEAELYRDATLDEGSDAGAYFSLDIQTAKTETRERLVSLIMRVVRDECKAAKTLHDPEMKLKVRTPLTENDDTITELVEEVFRGYFPDDVGAMQITRQCDDFSLLDDAPYTYWDFGGCLETGSAAPARETPYFAPAIQPTLRTGVDAMALAVLAYLVPLRSISKIDPDEI
ncbi:hypothetical protein GGR54DRAFT_355617 [Hypoxylon sp. NC1633]|nr:hypothetical protein GGR54DRAFT_355617 [Hypoxylon sp. NC1633]